MYSDERTQGLAKATPILEYVECDDLQRERMRHLANIVIDMFLKSRSANHDNSKGWVN
jgi:hypothetical protein